MRYLFAIHNGFVRLTYLFNVTVLENQNCAHASRKNHTKLRKRHVCIGCKLRKIRIYMYMYVVFKSQPKFF